MTLRLVYCMIFLFGTISCNRVPGLVQTTTLEPSTTTTQQPNATTTQQPVTTTTQQESETGNTNDHCVDIGWQNWSCKKVSRYYKKTYGYRPSDWCSDPYLNEICCEFCETRKASSEGTTPQTNTTTEETTTLSSECPTDEWTTYFDKCFKVFPLEFKTWEGARQHCKNLYSELVSVATAEENDFLISLPRSGTEFWIGLNDIDNDGAFVWSDGSALTFDNRNHDTSSSSNCVFFTPHEWVGGECDVQRSFVCKMYLGQVPGKPLLG